MKTKPKRKKHSGAFKAMVAMEAMLGVKTTAQIAREHSVHPVQVSQWKTVLRERMPDLFEAGGKQAEDTEKLIADLHRKIGELAVERRDLVDAAERISVLNQCELLGISRSGLYHQCQPETQENLKIMRRVDELHLSHPVYGSRRLTWLLERDGLRVNRKRVMRLLQIMGNEAIYPKARTSETGAGHRIFPYLLKGLEINGPDQV